MPISVASRLRWFVLLAAACGPTPQTDTSSTGTSTASVDPTPTTTTGTSTSDPSIGSSSISDASTAGSPSSGGSASEPTTDGSTTADPSTSSGESSSTGEPPPNHCPGGLPLFQLPELTVEEGLEICPDGQIHRHTAVECLDPLPIQECPANECPGPCDELGDGLCNTVYQGYCTCEYPCTTDADCKPGAACLCAGGQPTGGGGYNHFIGRTQCVPADCRTDADCGEFLCALSPGVCGYGGVLGLFCHTAEDDCVGNQDCYDQQLGNLCLFEAAEQRWKCTVMFECE